MAIKPIPDGYHSATPYLMVKGAADAIEFYRRAFGATELFRMADPQGVIGHAEIKIGDSVIMRTISPAPPVMARAPSAVPPWVCSFILRMSTPCSRVRSLPVASHYGRLPTSSTAIAPAHWKIPSAMSGRWQHTSRMCRQKRWRGVRRRR